ncbi:Acyl carrier protein [compost metagenome]
MVKSLRKIEVEQEVVKVLASSLAQSDRLIEADSRLVEELYLDSIALIELVLGLNEVFGIELSEREVAEWKTVREICCSVTSYIKLR